MIDYIAILKPARPSPDSTRITGITDTHTDGAMLLSSWKSDVDVQSQIS